MKKAGTIKTKVVAGVIAAVCAVSVISTRFRRQTAMPTQPLLKEEPRAALTRFR